MSLQSFDFLWWELYSSTESIDFDKVFTEFTRLGETGNISVLVTIACAFLLYIIVLIIARRADKKDENMVRG